MVEAENDQNQLNSGSPREAEPPSPVEEAKDFKPVIEGPYLDYEKQIIQETTQNEQLNVDFQDQ